MACVNYFVYIIEQSESVQNYVTGAHEIFGHLWSHLYTLAFYNVIETEKFQ